MKKDRAQMDGEERERAELDAQIARARAAEGEKPAEEVGLQKREGEKITLSFGAPVAATPSTPASEDVVTPAATAESTPGPASDAKPAITFGTIGTKPTTATPITINPLKRPAPVNVFKAAKSAKTDTSSDASTQGGGKKFMSEAERLMKEDQARRGMRAGPGMGGGGGYQGAGPRRTGDGGRRFVLQ